MFYPAPTPTAGLSHHQISLVQVLLGLSAVPPPVPPPLPSPPSCRDDHGETAAPAWLKRQVEEVGALRTGPFLFNTGDDLHTLVTRPAIYVVQKTANHLQQAFVSASPHTAQYRSGALIAEAVDRRRRARSRVDGAPAAVA